MKKIFLLFITGLTACASYSQEVSDAMRYSQDNLTGTARFRAMSGTFGAVGGDLSSMSVNPAGSAIFNNNQVGITFSNQSNSNDSNYYGTKAEDSKNSFILNQAGGVFVFHDRNPNNNWKKIAIGVSYENTNNFNNNIFSAGTNPDKSIGDYFTTFANGVPLGLIKNSYYDELTYKEQQAYLGYEGYVINPVAPLDDNNTQYISNTPAGGNYYQENEIYSRGYNGKLTFNVATSYKDRIFFGANLNAHITDYRRSTSFYEDNDNPLVARETISKLRFNNDLYTYGNGFSFQLGAIAKITESLRVGLAYESNTWYELYDETSQTLSTTRQASGSPELYEFVNPNVTNIYESYTLQTPGKATLSAAYVFGKSGLISVDYSIKDYGSTKFKPTGDSGFRELNNQMNNELTTNGELRIRGEYKINKLSLRGGYRFEGSPYKNEKTIEDLTSYSGGLGYSFGATKIDLAYSYMERKSNQPFFNVGFIDGANIKSKLNNVSLTLLFEL